MHLKTIHVALIFPSHKSCMLLSVAHVWSLILMELWFLADSLILILPPVLGT